MKPDIRNQPPVRRVPEQAASAPSAQLPNPAGAAKAHGSGLSSEAVADRLRAIASEIETGQVKAEKAVISVVTESVGAERTTVTVEFTRRS